MPTARFSCERLVGDRRGGADGDLDGRVVAAAGLDAALEVEEDPHVGGLLEVELLDLDLAVAGRRLPVDPVERVARRIRPDGRRQRGRLERPLGRRVAALERGRRQAPARQRLDPRVDDDGDRPGRPSPTPRRSRTGRRSGSGAARSGSGRGATAARGRSTTARLRPPSVIARPGQAARQRRRVVDLEPRLRHPAGVAQRVGHPHPVADVAVQLADGVAGLEVGQAEPDQDVAAADDEDRRGRAGRRGTAGAVENAATTRTTATMSSSSLRIIDRRLRRVARSVGQALVASWTPPRPARSSVGPPPVGRMPSTGGRFEQLADDLGRPGRRGSWSSS